MKNRIKDVLVVDDSETCKQVLGTIVSKSWHNVFYASNWIQAIELFKERIIDMIFIDVHMPDKRWDETAKEIRKIALETWKKVLKIVGISASVHTQEFHPEFDEVLLKPLNIKDIKNSLNW